MATPVDAWDSRFATFRRVAQAAARDPRVRALASRLANINELSPSLADARRLVSLSPADLRKEQCAMLLRAVQSRVSYLDDAPMVTPNAGEEACRVLSTWARGEGDCKDSAVLLCALALAVGCNARLLAMGWDGAPSHVACQLRPTPASPWLWAETTLPAELGEHPSDALERSDVARRDFAPRRGAIGAPWSGIHVAAAEVIKEAFQRVVGRAPSRFERQLLQTIAYTETSYGRGWKPPCDASHNWGSQHALGSEASCSWTDSYPDGTRYTQTMAAFPDDVSGAAGFIALIYNHMAGLRRALETGAGINPVAEGIYYSHYGGATCPKALARYGDAAKESLAFPPNVSHLKYDERAKTEAGKACEAECIATIAKRYTQASFEIADALREPRPTLGPALSSSSSALLPWLVGGGAVVVAGGVVYFATRRKRAA